MSVSTPYLARIEIRPQPGPQEAFLSSTADIVGYGGAAGGGKTWSILTEPLYHVNNPEFGAVIFRRSMPQIMNEGGLWEEARRMYTPLGAKPRILQHEWVFPSGMTVRFAHLQYDDTTADWQGSQIPLIAFDELTHFTEYQFFYMMSRLRSMSDVKGYVRATFNPDASSWVKKFFAPWVDDQYPDPAIGGEIRYFIRVSGIVTWFRDKATALEQLRMSDPSADDEDVKSATFIPSTVYDNPKMLEKNPGYIGWLKSLPPVERARLLMGDWNVLPAAGKVYDRTWFEIVSRIPSGTPTVQTGWGDIISHGVHQSEVRFWDFAGTEKKLKGPQPDFTAGVKLRLVGDTYYVVDVIQVQLNPAGVDQLIVDTARLDGPECMVRWEEEGGASGKRDTYHIATMLNGYDANGVRPLGDKITRSRGVVSQARAGNVKILRAPWNDAFLNELHHLPDWKNDDQADALSGAYLVLTEESGSIGRSENPTDY